MASPREIEQWLQKGILAAKAGQFEQARFQLLDVVEADQTNEVAWYWLYQVFDRVDDKRTCLENLILINPKNMWAKQELLNVLEASVPVAAGPYPQPPPYAARPPLAAVEDDTDDDESGRPITLKLVTAFWVGISLIFLGGGIISALEWLVSQTTAGLDIPFPLLDLTLSVIFIIGGVMGLTIAAALFYQSMIGFYGSIFLALGLLLVGPTFSLISNPPNYVAMTCTGGISGVIVLLTLASQPGFKNTQPG
ncbi:MAG: hypothetical protein Kow0031_11740 [Anaerolineae bacterium]